MLRAGRRGRAPAGGGDQGLGRDLGGGGTALLVGTDVHRIVDQTALLLEDAELHERMSRPFTPYGDGHASERIAARLCAWLEQRRAEKRCA